MAKRRVLNILLALVACFELVSLINCPIHPVAASNKAFSINLCSSLGKLPIEENDIEIAGVGSDFCLFNEFSDISSASEKIIAFKSTPIKIKNNSMQAIQIYINKFRNNSEKYNIVNREDLSTAVIIWPLALLTLIRKLPGLMNTQMVLNGFVILLSSPSNTRFLLIFLAKLLPLFI